MKALVISQRLAPAGYCIYCGCRNNLELEHIIPHGIWGRIEFPQASCRCCAKQINESFEQHVQTKQLGLLRQRSKIPTRKRRKRNFKSTLSFASINGAPPRLEPVEVSADEIPSAMLLMRFMPPKILVGPWSSPPELWYYCNPEEQEKFLDAYPFSAHFAGDIDLNKWCRLIAKIGHGLVVGLTPVNILSTFNLLLPELILKGSDDMHRLVGGDLTVPPASDLMHEIDVADVIKGDTEYLLARVRLFANLGAPRYHAVVASRPFSGTALTKDPVRFPSA